MESSQEIHVGDLQGLIFALTQDPWQPSEAKYRINAAYRGLSSEQYPLETGLSRLQGEEAGLYGLCRWLARYCGDRPEQAYPDAQISPTESAETGNES